MIKALSQYFTHCAEEAKRMLTSKEGLSELAVDRNHLYLATYGRIWDQYADSIDQLRARDEIDSLLVHEAKQAVKELGYTDFKAHRSYDDTRTVGAGAIDDELASEESDETDETDGSDYVSATDDASAVTQPPESHSLLLSVAECAGEVVAFTHGPQGREVFDAMFEDVSSVLSGDHSDATTVIEKWTYQLEMFSQQRLGHVIRMTIPVDQDPTALPEDQPMVPRQQEEKLSRRMRDRLYGWLTACLTDRDTFRRHTACVEDILTQDRGSYDHLVNVVLHGQPLNRVADAHGLNRNTVSRHLRAFEKEVEACVETADDSRILHAEHSNVP
jgi:hypothetical protein